MASQPNFQESQIKTAIQAIIDPLSQQTILDANRVSGIAIKDTMVQLSLDISNPTHAKTYEPVSKAIEAAIYALEGITNVTVIMTAEKSSKASDKAAPVAHQHTAHAAANHEAGIGKIKKVIAVASGKGGVGKSTTAINLAYALLLSGLKVGLLDADIYGPSLPRMLGKREAPRTADNRTMLPIEVNGLKAMSIGFVVDEDEPIIWRGPMVMGALNQMLKDVIWGELDVLVVDMPPGTGDAQLTLTQQVPLAGAVIVSTPQDIALLDARKGLNMFRKTDVPVLGLIENMSMFICPNCGHESHIFGHGGARAEAAKLGAPFLGEIPLELDIRLAADKGHAIVLAQPKGPHAKHYIDIAEKLRFALFGDSDNAPTQSQKARPAIKIT